MPQEELLNWAKDQTCFTISSFKNMVANTVNASWFRYILWLSADEHGNIFGLNILPNNSCF